MMEWISIKERLPEEGQHCWACDLDKNVFNGVFRNMLIFVHSSDIDCDVEKGFCVDEEMGSYARISEVTYWMPYFTPDPPKHVDVSIENGIVKIQDGVFDHYCERIDKDICFRKSRFDNFVYHEYGKMPCLVRKCPICGSD